MFTGQVEIKWGRGEISEKANTCSDLMVDSQSNWKSPSPFGQKLEHFLVRCGNQLYSPPILPSLPPISVPTTMFLPSLLVLIYQPSSSPFCSCADHKIMTASGLSTALLVLLYLSTAVCKMSYYTTIFSSSFNIKHYRIKIHVPVSDVSKPPCIRMNCVFLPPPFPPKKGGGEGGCSRGVWVGEDDQQTGHCMRCRLHKAQIKP